MPTLAAVRTMTVPFVHDASFYELVHKILNAPPSDKDEERDRRVALREQFPTVQFIGPIVAGKLPKIDALRPVTCCDLSTSGMSFYAAQPPESDRLVVRLAASRSATYLLADIVHCRPQADGGERAYLIGCRFTGRVER